MRTFDNPHPRQQGWMQPHQPQPMQPQLTQEQAMHQALQQSMAANGFIMQPTNNGQTIFYNQQTGAAVGYQQAMQMLQQRAAQAQQGYGYPQQQSFYEPQVRQQPFNPNQPQYPAGSFQAANQRFTAPAGSVDTQVDTARWGQAPQQQPTLSQPPEKPVMTHPTPTKEVFTLPFATAEDKTPFVYRPSKLVKVNEAEHDFTGSSLYSLAEQIRLEAKSLKSGAHPCVLVANVFHTDSYILPRAVTDSELFTEVKTTDPRQLYRTMTSYANGKVHPTGLSGALFTSMLLNLDRDLTQAVNDFMKLTGVKRKIDSFCEDYNQLLKKLRDTTDTVEDELNDYLQELLKSRVDVILNEDKTESEDTVFASRETLVLVDLPITNFQLNYNDKGDLTVSKTVRDSIGLMAKEIDNNIFYISTLDKSILRVYRPYDDKQDVIVEVMGFKD